MDKYFGGDLEDIGGDLNNVGGDWELFGVNLGIEDDAFFSSYPGI